MVTWSTWRLRSAIISSRFRKLSPNRRYQRTHRTMISASKCRPLNSAGRFGRIHCKIPDTLPYWLATLPFRGKFYPLGISLSPDGQQLAFGSGDFDSQKQSIYVVGVDGSNLREV